jgi:LPPG:FO 2-phospho-L-lactate transferase
MRMMVDLGIEPSAAGIARHYRDVIDGLVIDEVDAGSAAEIEDLGVRVLVAATIMRTAEDKARLAAAAVDFACNFAGGR